MKVIFFQVNNIQEKILRIAKIANIHFLKKMDLFIYSSELALNYLDEILWKEPQLGFLPHSINEPKELIHIGTRQEDLNQASHILNLQPMALTEPLESQVIYELDDNTSLSKKTLSTEKFKVYKEKGILISEYYPFKNS